MDSVNQPKQFASVVEESRQERQRVRTLVSEGRWQDAEPDRNRFRQFTDRRNAKIAPSRGAEALIGPTVDLQGTSFLTEGAMIRRAVAYVEVNDTRSSEVGSGFLISPRLFMTNRHVIRDEGAAHAAQITFDREMDELGQPRPATTYLLDPGAFALFSDIDALDYAVIAVGRLNSGAASLPDLGYCVLSDTPDRHAIGMNVNIIEHPRGLPKMIAVRNNPLTFRTDRTLLYETDTDQGSSGSPVFNDEWDLVALHHWGQPYLEKKDDQGKEIPINVNEGVRISAIYRDLKSRLGSLSSSQREMLTQALAYSDQAAVATGGKTLSGPRPGSESGRLLTNQKGANVEQSSTGNELRITIPIEITVRVGSQGYLPIEIQAGGATAPPKVLSRGSEALKIDQDYGNRSGYKAKFIPGIELALPDLNASLLRQLAPLRAEEPAAAAGELKYEHFSIKMNKGKRIAIFTATNIDGPTYLEVDRGTGQVRDAEGETWYKDPRISASFFLDQTFYSAWSTYFDRGHLTRRTDPTWGTNEEAERANADTYHFTNCSPQHFRFNESAKFWQGAERYVLENGLLAADSLKRISVFQGPLFDSQIDLWSDDVQIPSSFFKVVVWKGANGLKAVGLIVDQLSLLSEARKSLGPPRDLPSVNVSQWRVSIPQIEKRSGLDFGKTIRDADTINASGQPRVGEEAATPIRSLQDILA